MKLKSTGFGSDKYGACEICKKHCSEVWLLSDIGSHHGGGIFGHKECLDKSVEKIQKAWDKESKYCLNFGTPRSCKYFQYNHCIDSQNPTNECVFNKEE